MNPARTAFPLAAAPATRRGGLWQHWLVLVKLPIALASMLTALLGFRMAGGALGGKALWLVTGTMLLAMGAGALNQIQERDSDARMFRTRTRPLPAGSLSLQTAWIGCLLLASGGLGALGFGTGLAAAAIGLATLLWYNGVYTPLKRRFAWSVLLGALVGVLPPCMGWVAAGRTPLEAPLLALGLLFFVWQIPHFWMLLLIHGEDYARAGFPTPLRRLSSRRAARQAFGWILLLVLVSALVPVTGLIRSPLGLAGLLLGDVGLLWSGKRLLSRAPEPRWGFLAINLFALAAISLMLADAFLR